MSAVDSLLSLEAAAHEHPERVALIIKGTEYTYAGLAEKMRGVPLSRRFSPTFSVVDLLQFYRALQERRPLHLLPAFSDESEFAAIDLDDFDTHQPEILAVLQTSGSSGASKAVVLSRQAFIASAQASATNLGWKDEDRWLLNLPLFHVGGLSIVIRCLMARRTVVIGEDFHQTCEQQRVTLASLVPTQLQRILPAKPPPDLRAVLIGGAPLSQELRAKARAQGWPVLSTYGMTETCSQIATWPIDQLDDADARGVGRLLPGVEARLRGKELVVRGPMLFSGYWNEGRRKDDEWFHTGDLAELREDGWLAITGRKSDLIISGGENIYPQEILPHFLNLESIQEAVVLGLPDEEWGQIVTLAYVGSVSPDALRKTADSFLSGHRKPKRYLKLKAMPLLENGKCDRQAIIRQASSAF